MWPTWVLAILAGLAAWIGVRTLGSIDRQAIETARSASATEKSVEALTTIESPYLSTCDLTAQIVYVDIPTKPFDRPYVFYRFKNDGRTPAVLIEVQHGIHCYRRNDLPTKPDYSQMAILDQGGVVVPPNGISDLRWMCAAPANFAETTNFAQIIVGDVALYFYGLVRYRDLFGRIYRTGFCWHYQHPTSMGVAGGEAYNYRRTET